MPLTISEIVGQRRIEPPPGFCQGGAPVDSPEMEDGRGDVAGSLVGTRLALVYVDAAGAETQRFVTVKNAIRCGDVWCLQAHCELRKALRTFRVDRIREIIDPRTGEIHEDPVRFLYSLLFVARALRPDRRERVNPTERLIAESQHGLTVLLFFAHSDLKLKRKERTILWTYLAWQQNRCAILGKVPRRPLNAWMDALVPDTDQFVEALMQLMRSERIHSRYVLARVPEIVMADKHADVEERRRLRMLLELLDAPVTSVRLGRTPPT